MLIVTDDGTRLRAIFQLLRESDETRRSMWEQRSKFLGPGDFKADLDLLRFAQIIDDCEDRVRHFENRARELDALAHPDVVAFLSADEMFVRSMRLFQHAINAKTRDEFVRRVGEANEQMELASEALADAMLPRVIRERQAGLADAEEASA